MSGVSKSDTRAFLAKLTFNEFLKNVLADSKLSGINLEALPLTSETSTQFPSTSDWEQTLTALASS